MGIFDVPTLKVHPQCEADSFLAVARGLQKEATYTVVHRWIYQVKVVRGTLQFAWANEHESRLWIKLLEQNRMWPTELILDHPCLGLDNQGSSCLLVKLQETSAN